MTTNQAKHLLPALKIELSHLALAALWNIICVALIRLGYPPLGPVASLILVGIMFLLAAILAFSIARHRVTYLLVSLLLLLGCIKAIFDASVGDASLWPHPVWRYAGMLINSIGVLGAFTAIRLWCSLPTKPSTKRLL